MQSFHTNDPSPQIVGIVAVGCVNLISDVWCRQAKFFGVFLVVIILLITRIGKGRYMYVAASASTVVYCYCYLPSI